MERLEVVEDGRLQRRRQQGAGDAPRLHRAPGDAKALIDGDVHAADAYVESQARRAAPHRRGERGAPRCARARRPHCWRRRPLASHRGGGASDEGAASFRRAGGSDGAISSRGSRRSRQSTRPTTRRRPPTRRRRRRGRRRRRSPPSTRARAPPPPPPAAPRRRQRSLPRRAAAAHGGGGAVVVAGGGGRSPLRMALLEVQIIAARDLVAMDANLFGADSSDPYAEITLGGEVLARTHVVVHSLSPTWDASFRLELPPSRVEHELASSADLVLALWDRDLVGRDDPLGEVRLPLRTLIGAPPAPRWHAVVGDGRISRNARASGELYVAATLALRRAATAAAAAATMSTPSSLRRSRRRARRAHRPRLPNFAEVARPSTDLPGAAAEALRARTARGSQSALSLASPVAAPPRRPPPITAPPTSPPPAAAPSGAKAPSPNTSQPPAWRRAEVARRGRSPLAGSAAQCDADAPAPGDSRGEGDEGAAVGRRRRGGRMRASAVRDASRLVLACVREAARQRGYRRRRRSSSTPCASSSVALTASRFRSCTLSVRCRFWCKPCACSCPAARRRPQRSAAPPTPPPDRALAAARVAGAHAPPPPPPSPSTTRAWGRMRLLASRAPKSSMAAGCSRRRRSSSSTTAPDGGAAPRRHRRRRRARNQRGAAWAFGWVRDAQYARRYAATPDVAEAGLGETVAEGVKPRAPRCRR